MVWACKEIGVKAEENEIKASKKRGHLQDINLSMALRGTLGLMWLMSCSCFLAGSVASETTVMGMR